MTKITEITDETAPVSTTIALPALKTKQDALSTVKARALKAAAEATAPSGSDPLPLGELKLAEVGEILIEDRPRKDMGNLKTLARSLQEVGLVQPVLLDAQMRLVTGHRRVEAAKLLGWKEIPARVVDVQDALALTAAEDTNRKPLTPSEKFAVCRALKRRAKDADWRKSAFGGRFDAVFEKSRLDEVVAQTVDLSRETLRKLSAIQEAAEADVARFGFLAEKLDVDGKVDRHYRTLERMQGRGDAGAAAAIVVAPGWHALYDKAEAKDVTHFVKKCLFAFGADEGTVLVLPSRVESLGEAVGHLKQGGFEWRKALRGSGADGEDVWLVGALGKKTEISSGALELIAEGCLKGLEAILQAAEVAFDGDVRSLELSYEEEA